MRTATIIVLLATSSAAADDLKDSDYRAMDDAFKAVVSALDTGDTATFATYVGAPFKTLGIWFDSATCRKKFGTATVKAKDARAFAKCFAGLEVWQQGMNIHYGPGVLLNAIFDVKDGKATVKSLTSGASFDKTLPKVWRKTFEANRLEGELKVSLDDDALAELAEAGEGGVVFDVCIDKKGAVTKTIVMPVIARNGPTAKQIKASTKNWRFKPFLVRGKPAPVCGTESAKLTGELKL